MRAPPAPSASRLLCMAGVVALSAGGSRSAGAAELPNAHLEVLRTLDAGSCPDEETIARELSARLTAKNQRTLEPLFVRADLTRDGEELVLRLEVKGRKQGERVLRARGPSCDALHEALIVALLILLDEDSERPEAARLPPGRVPTPDPIPSRKEGPSVWVGAGWQITHGIPVSWSGAGVGELSVRLPGWEIAGATVWAPARTVPSAPGEVRISVWGVRARVCYSILSERTLRVSGCALGMGASLRGEGIGLREEHAVPRPWWLAGGGAEAYLPLTSRIGLGVAANLLVTMHAEAFVVDGLPGKAYETDSVVGGLGADLRVRLW